MMAAPIRITGARITPVAFADPPLLNTVGVHQPYALRAIIQLDTDAGIVGLGETYADTAHVARMEAAAEAITGLDVFALNEIRSAIDTQLASSIVTGGDGVAGMITTASTTDRVFSPFEVACLDVQGKILGRPVSDLLGGRVRDAVPFSAYLFYKWAAHPGAEPDEWGEALDPGGLVRQARKMIGEYGFGAIKVKGGVFPPDEEIAGIKALREAFPELPLRLDPNAAWTVDTSIRVAGELDGIVEYLEDPTPGLDGMAEVAREAKMPLATNMCVVAFDQLKPAVLRDSVQVVLSDHHYWGGLQRSRLLAGVCDNFDMGLSMHSNSHLGISLAAMVHLAAATPNLTYACDTHWPWKTEDVVKPGVLEIVDGVVAVPTGPGLGIEIDDDALAALHRQYLDCGLRDRDDTGYMKSIDPSFENTSPRW
ncbi:glucarate dehydratase [Rhodococcus sp. BP-252]|uniref:glucarate dehydratase family protein n=1 Tax=unclassified Rhodococcus (in: high G+C Gram-positive bacteria) TaxID=192944 RepID=UPI001431999A|nr:MULTISPECIES: glucarate dehydratase family protein [unclassified Rhodococcus (in: high G+C Gram-positive bacteria)]MBY6412973.1 glucarate dehydratase [Rhodococcus sp. BP-320]MBY6419754.1 glucarate dehydratase [Rhodococcus sp. BP-321]MBY6423833.1 glucarate dehydratase [Rhodococcus sp. BP-324]MBY6429157.1 glucarate dehydratase [Rhodococcus sp. BP-323]MBY6432895.1 glucarate dehydratase [Rhodococcus sp. BP-322]